MITRGTFESWPCGIHNVYCGNFLTFTEVSPTRITISITVKSLFEDYTSLSRIRDGIDRKNPV
jgi:hypothetical protein